jgi:hypothetical protein
MHRPMPIALAALLSSCTLSPISDGDETGGEPTRADMIEACEEARTCRLDQCANEQAAFDAHDATEPTYEQTCEEFCAAECMAGNIACDAGSLTLCEIDCGEMRDAEHNAWTETWSTLWAARNDCIAANCIAPYTEQQVNSETCESDSNPGYGPYDVLKCAIGAGAFGDDECAEKIDCWLAGGPCF